MLLWLYAGLLLQKHLLNNCTAQFLLRMRKFQLEVRQSSPIATDTVFLLAHSGEMATSTEEAEEQVS